jgi:Zn-dependent protease/CBS domain-containing protein
MHSFKLGRVFGIELRVDWSWIFIFVLLTWSLFQVFSRWHPDWSPAGDLAVAGTAALAFFGCVLLHELAHSLVAIGFKMRVRSITLFLFGGVSNLEREPRSAGAEFLMAIAGPITSVLLGLGFTVLGSLVAPRSLVVTGSLSSPGDPWGALAQLGPLPTLLLWLGPVNVLIGLFNLIPGFPLDGGRVLRSAIWAVSGDLRLATRCATGMGLTIGWAFVVAGIAMAFGARVPFFGTGLAGGLWLALIGWFLSNAASRAGSRLAIEESLAGHTVEDLMARPGPAVSDDLPVATLVHDYLVGGDERSVPVVRDDRLVGIASVAGVRATPIERWASTPVRDIMQPPRSLPVASPGEPLADAFEEMAREEVDSLPVLAGDRLVGTLRRRDLAKWLELVWRPGARGARGDADWPARARRSP